MAHTNTHGGSLADQVEGRFPNSCGTAGLEFNNHQGNSATPYKNIMPRCPLEKEKDTHTKAPRPHPFLAGGQDDGVTLQVSSSEVRSLRKRLVCANSGVDAVADDVALSHLLRRASLVSMRRAWQLRIDMATSSLRRNKSLALQVEELLCCTCAPLFCESWP